MCWSEVINLNGISNYFMRTVMLLVLGLSSYDTGWASHVYSDVTKFYNQPENTATISLKSFSSPKTETYEETSEKVVLHDKTAIDFGKMATVDAAIMVNHLNKNEENKRHERFNNIQMLNKITQIGDTIRENNKSYQSLLNTNKFETENSSLIRTQIGATALIPCKVSNLGEEVVSWIRKRDYHLLTVGLTTYSSDERFSTIHLNPNEDWTLQIKFVQLNDAGIYECQVSTHPPTSIFLYLEVVEARAEIPGPSIRYLTPGSTLRLQCHVVQNTESSEYIFWYHDNRMINYDFDRGVNVSLDADFQTSELVVTKTRREHSGNYTCVASNSQPASVLVHIFKGDNPAAMYHGHVDASRKSYQPNLPYIFVIFIVIMYRIFVIRCLVLK